LTSIRAGATASGSIRGNRIAIDFDPRRGHCLGYNRVSAESFFRALDLYREAIILPRR